MDRRGNWIGRLAMANWAHVAMLLPCALSIQAQSTGMEWIGVSPESKGFVFKSSGHPFVPWGFNYDHDEQERLIEDYWEAEWAKVEEDFNAADISQAIAPLGANGFNIHETAPYLNSGLAQTLEEVLDGSHDNHGRTRHRFVTDPQ